MTYPTIYLKAQANSVEISTTNAIQISLKQYAEAFSDMQIWSYDTNGLEIKYDFYQNSNTGFSERVFGLGKSSDERKECVELRQGRRVGVCEDGSYKFVTQSTDAAGNTSSQNTFLIQRDTVKPETPTLGIPYLCGNNICLDIKGESGANIFVNSTAVGLSDWQQAKTFVVLKNWEYDKTYEFIIWLEDAATNISDSVKTSLQTPIGGFGNGLSDSLIPDNPWGDAESNKFEFVKFDVDVNVLNQDYEISNVQIPTPEITLIYTEIDKVVSIYAVGVAKTHKLKANAAIAYLTFMESWGRCEKKSVLGIFYPDNLDCMQQKMGINNLWKWENDIRSECLVGIPLLTDICINNKKHHKRLTKSQVFETSVQNSLVTFTKVDGTFVSNIWNDLESGKVLKQLTLDKEVMAKDLIRAHTSIFGSFEIGGVNIDFRGLNKDSAKANQGLVSDFSLAKEVPAPRETFLDPVGFPFRNFKFANQCFSRYFGQDKANEICQKIGTASSLGRGVVHISRGANQSGHGPNAIDFAPYAHDYSAPMVLVSTVEGTFITDKNGYGSEKAKLVNGKWKCTTSNGYNWLVATVNGKNGRQIQLGHIDPKSTQLKNWQDGKYVYRGEAIGLMGNTGCSTNTHLHYVVSGNTKELYASLTDTKGLNTLPENINYVRNKANLDEYVRKYQNAEKNLTINF